MRARLALGFLLLTASVTAHAQVPATPQATATAQGANPFFSEWRTPFGVPPFGEIREEHFLPALTEGMAAQKREVEALAARTDAPTFANTIEALEASGKLLDRVQGVFQNLTSAETTDGLQAIAKQVAPLLAAHNDDIVLDETLFRRVRAVWDGREASPLDPEREMLLEKAWKRFVRGGALLSKEQKDRMRAVNEELAGLSVKFGDDLLKEMNAWRLVVERKDALAGLGERELAGAAEAAKKAGLEGRWVFTLHAPSLWPFLGNAENRDLRKQMFTAYITRCDHGDATDSKKTLTRIAVLRAERARLLGYATHADFVLDENMAKTPAKVREFLDRLWTPAKRVAAAEASDLRQAIRAEGGDFALEPWDWFYYTEKVRKAKFDLDEEALRPYFPLERVREGAFEVARRLYGLSFTPLPDLPVYNPEVRAFEVKDGDGSHLAVFYVDYHPRKGKRGGAWSSRVSRHLGRRRQVDPPGRRQRLQLLAPGRRRAGAALARGGGDPLPRVRARAPLDPLDRPLPRPRPRRRGTSSSCPRRSWRTGRPRPRC